MTTETFEAFARAIPDRQLRRVVLARDEIAAERDRCARTQAWAPSARRSSWAYELGLVVDAIDALRAAHEAVEEAEEAEDEDAREDAVEARAAAADAVEAAVEAAEERQRDLAGRVAEAQAAVAIERIERAAYEADDDAEWGQALADLVERSATDGDCGWTVALREEGGIVVTGWAQGRVVTDQDGDVLLGPDFSAVEEHEVTGSVGFVITLDDDGSEEPNSSCATVAEAVSAAESLAEVHGLECWSEAWTIGVRWVEVAS